MLVLPSQQIYSFIMSQDSIDNYRDDLYAHREVVEPGGIVSTAEEYITGRNANGSVRTITHKVARGETLSTIAAKYNMTTADVMALNNMSSERVRRGDNIKVKAPTHYNASADNDEIIAVTSDSNSQGSNDLAINEQQDGQTEQDQFDEVKDIEREAATKAPYKGSYTVNVDDIVITLLPLGNVPDNILKILAKSFYINQVHHHLTFRQLAFLHIMLTYQ